MSNKELAPIEFKTDPYISGRRTKIDSVIARSGFSSVPDEINGIYIVETTERRPRAEDGFRYVFGQDASASHIRELINRYPDSPMAYGSIAIYYDKNHFTVHVGVVVENGNIVSKWGPYGHVFRHMPELVPSCYGEIGKSITLDPKEILAREDTEHGTGRSPQGSVFSEAAAFVREAVRQGIMEREEALGITDKAYRQTMLDQLRGYPVVEQPEELPEHLKHFADALNPDGSVKFSTSK